MVQSASTTRSWRDFHRVCVVIGVATLGFAVLLSPLVPIALRTQVSGVGLLIGGAVAAVTTFRRAGASSGAERRPWRLLCVAALLAVAGNLWVSATGSDPTNDPSLISTASIAIALLLSIAAVVSFPGVRRRGPELVITLLDGLVAGGAFLLIASVAVFSSLLQSDTSTTTFDRVTGLAFPVLDVLLATVAVLLVVRAKPADRLMLVLVAGAFLLYAASDLSYAVRSDRGDFYFGTMLDLGWIVGYLLIGLAASTPVDARPERSRLRASVAEATGTSLVFTVLIVATVIQVLFNGGSSLERAQSGLWVVIVLAAGVRQVILTADNNALRRGLEQRVEEQTADLRRLARQNEVLVTSVGDGVYGVDDRGRITFVNPSAADSLGARPDELEGRQAHDVFHAPTADGTPHPWDHCYVYEAITHGLVSAAEEDEYMRADGSSFDVEITAAPLMDADEIRGAVVVFRDVTERLEMDRMKDEFLSVVSHELRTPLTSIRGSLGLLAGGRMGELPERAATLVAVASQSTDRLTRLINDLLDIERLQTGARPLELKTHDARDLLETAAHQLEGMGAQLGVFIEVAETHGRILADEDNILQTLINLVGNALKFSERGSGVRIDAYEEGREVHFRVADEGRGVPADKLEAVFERFQQVDSSDTRQNGGTGLGLTISKGIVERHGGLIWIESELGVGTTVHVTLPAAPPSGSADPVPATGSAASTVAVVTRHAGDGPGEVRGAIAR